MDAQYCFTGSEWGIEAEECGMKVLGREVEGREGRNFLALFSRGVLGGRQREQAVRDTRRQMGRGATHHVHVSAAA